MEATDVIKRLDLVPLPEEGGFYKETYRDKGKIPSTAFLERKGERNYSSCIYYLITPEEFSGLHAVKSTEIFHFYAGDPVEMVQINAAGKLSKFILGNNLTQNEVPQVIVEPMVWQGTKLLPGGKWALLGCTVAPGFEFEDFIIENRQQLINRFPKLEDLIVQFTRK